MNQQNQQIETTLQDIKSMMERSSRFISLSGWSGVAAGLCALIGAWYTSMKFPCWRKGDCLFGRYGPGESIIRTTILEIGVVTFLAALFLAFLFTYIRSKKTGIPIWGYTARRLMINVIIPMVIGGIFIYRLGQLGYHELYAPACLLFYGLALVNASKYTLIEIRYLGFGQLILGIINLWYTNYGLYFWAVGFGVLHIIYGLWMWRKYEA